MARKGESKTQKKLSAPKVRKMPRKNLTWTIKTIAGPHSSDESIPLGFVLRDLLKVGEKLKEVKKILKKGMVLVDEKKRKNHKFPVGLFDLISLPNSKKKFRALLDKKRRIVFVETNLKENTKIVKIVRKKQAKKGKIQLTSNDGRTFIEKESKIKVGDSVKIALPSQKILKHLELKKGNLVYLCGGKFVGETAEIKEVIPGTIKRKKMLLLEKEKQKFKTVEKNAIVVGEKKPEISLSEKK